MDQTAPSMVGARAEMAVSAALHRAGWDVFVPLFSAHSRIDLVIGRGPEVVRVQCKTSTISAGAVRFRVCSNTRNVPLDYVGQIDCFGVYSPHLDRVYLVPIEAVPSRVGSLRIEPTRNGQATGIRWAADYEIGRP